MPYVVAVWDVFLVDGWKALFRVVLALLDCVAADLSISGTALH